jgi:hypothetical protein
VGRVGNERKGGLKVVQAAAEWQHNITGSGMQAGPCHQGAGSEEQNSFSVCSASVRRGRIGHAVAILQHLMASACSMHPTRGGALHCHGLLFRRMEGGQLQHPLQAPLLT